MGVEELKERGPVLFDDPMRARADPESEVSAGTPLVKPVLFKTFREVLARNGSS